MTSAFCIASLTFTHTENVKCRVMFIEVYLEPSRISAIQFFCERLIGVNYFCKKAPSQMFARFLNMHLDLEAATSVLQKKLFLIFFCNIHRKTSVSESLLTKLQAISRIWTEYEYLSVLVSFRIQSECGKKTEKKNCGSFRSLWLQLLISIMKRCTEQCALQL